MEPAAADAARAATDLTSVIGAAGGSSGVVAALAWMFFKGKLDSLGLLWKKLDAMRDEIAAQRLADSKEFATRAEVTASIEKLEAHFDKRFDSLEAKLDRKD